jgi:Transposase DDE domain group 1
MGDPTGAADRGALRHEFDRRLMFQFRGSVIDPGAGLLPYRELDDTLDVTDTGGMRANARTAKNGRHRLVGLLRLSVFGWLAGYKDLNDADRLCHDPAMRWMVGDRAITGSAASASQMGRFETKWLSRPENLVALTDLPGRWIDKVYPRRPPRIIVLDTDSSEGLTYDERKAARTTATSAALVITRCSCSISLAMWSDARRERAQCRWLARGARAGGRLLSGQL